MKELNARKARIALYEANITDVALEVSQSVYWRQLLFLNAYEQKYLLSSDSEHEIPVYIRSIILENKLQFYVSKVLKCPILYLNEEDYVIFKFESLEFPEINRYSGN